MKISSAATDLNVTGTAMFVAGVPSETTQIFVIYVPYAKPVAFKGTWTTA
jgi:hypothetical protein